MSQPKFAPITANLLARKGSAMPSVMTSFAAASRAIEPPVPQMAHPSETPMPDAHAGGVLHAPHDPSRPKKLFVAFSHCEHERLAIAAVKTGLSRHQIVRDALDAYFEQLSRDLGHECLCVSGCCGKSS